MTHPPPSLHGPRPRHSPATLASRAAFALAAALVAPAAVAPPAAAQSLWLGGRAGTLGTGADISVAVTDWFVLRGGAGLVAVDADVTGIARLADHRTARLALPKALYTVGADLEIGNFRIGGGMLYKEEDPRYALTLAEGATIAIGEGNYAPPQVTRLTTTLESEPWAPYALLGFGQHKARGLGLFLDVGVAFLDHPELTMSARGAGSVLRSRAFLDDLRLEQQRVRDDIGDLVRYWPILNLGVRYGFGLGGRDRWEGRRAGWRR